DMRHFLIENMKFDPVSVICPDVLAVMVPLCGETMSSKVPRVSEKAAATAHKPAVSPPTSPSVLKERLNPMVRDVSLLSRSRLSESVMM
ncbi:MAG: hypothetical protein K0S21_1152, partial [Rhizobiaceae bacterium]|nr:hypothetical protein [Rhizobiaceae bacterium]